MSRGPKLFTCPKCRNTYLGHDPLPDCPRCGYDYREREGFRWDILVYLLSIFSLVSFLLVASHYRDYLGARLSESSNTPTLHDPSRTSEGAPAMPFQSPTHEPGR
jgi:hypothetical protein